MPGSGLRKESLLQRCSVLLGLLIFISACTAFPISVCLFTRALCFEVAGAEASLTLFRAASNGDTETVRSLLAKDKYDINWRGEYGMSPLHIATLNNHPDTAKLLIESGAKANQFDDDGWTPLMAAAAFADVRLVRLLLESGANPTRRAQSGHHKGMNAKDLVKDLANQKPTAVKKCVALLEGSPHRMC